MEGALECVFKGMRKLSIRCVVTTGKPRPGRRLPFVGPGPSCRTRQEEHALSIVRDQFRSAIPPRVARQHGPLLLHRHGQHKAIAQSGERIYHRTAVNSVLTVCLTGRAHPKASSGSDQSSIVIRLGVEQAVTDFRFRSPRMAVSEDYHFLFKRNPVIRRHGGSFPPDQSRPEPCATDFCQNNTVSVTTYPWS
jgi:hypothetical protein